MVKKLSRIKAEGLLVITTSVWGSTFLIIQTLVAGKGFNSPFALLTSRFLLATLLALVVFYPGRKPDRKELIGGLIIGGAAFLGYTAQTIGLTNTTPARSGFITSLFVLFVPFVSMIWERKKIPIFVFIALIPAGFGLWQISGVGKGILDINPGDKITLLSALAYAFQIVGIQVYTKDGDWRWLAILQFAVIAILSTICLIFEDNSVLTLDPKNIIAIVYLAFAATVGALGVQMFAQRFTTSARASLIYIAEPIFASGFAWIFASQYMTQDELLGAGAIILSMFIGRIKYPDRKTT